MDDDFTRALQFHQRGDLAQAEASYRDILEADANHVGALNNLAAIFLQQRRFDEACGCLRRAVHIQPDYVLGHINLGNALKELGQWHDAIECYRRATHLNPRSPEAHYNLGCALVEQEEYAEAINAFREALQINPLHAETHYNLANVFGVQGLLDEAVASYREAIRLRPDYIDAHINLGNTLKDQKLFAESAESYRQAVRVAGSGSASERMALWNLACLRLLLGEYAAAWPGYEQRWTQPGSGQSSFQLPQWNDKDVLVTSDQALGDTIQFARYLPLIQTRGGNVVFGCQPALAGLMAGLVGADKVIAQPGPWPACDMHMQLLSLPGIFGTTLATIPKDIPYLHAKHDLVDRWRGEIRRGENRFQVGIVWQGSMTIKGDRRSCHLSQFAPLAEIPNVSLVSLQVGAATAEIAGASFPIVDLGSRFDKNSLDDLAAVIANLDLVVTVDTAAAHLAGALGVSVWTLLQFVPDWRWLLDRNDSPWYPTMRLFRQKRWGDWEEVFERVATELECKKP